MRPILNDFTDVPLDLSDLLTLCKEYSRLGFNLQNQVEILIDCGVETAINQRLIARSSLPHIRAFLKTIEQNALFGDSSLQANELITAIDFYAHKNPIQATTAN